MKDFGQYFKKVPQEQYLMLKKFIEKHPIKTYNKDGKPYRYLKAGKGNRTLVFVHGAMFNPYMWFYPIRILENEYTIIAPQLPKIGMGANDSVDYIKKILDIENVKKASIIGYSYGGGVAQYFAEVYPNYTDTLILSHTGVLKRDDSIIKTQKLIKKVKFLPSFFIKIIKIIRTMSGKKSKWYRFRNGLFAWMSSEITKKDFLDHFNMNMIFYNDIKHLSVGKVSWKGDTILLATESDKDTYHYFNDLKRIYTNSIYYVFKEDGGHHMIFLYPEKYTNNLKELLHEVHTSHTTM